MQTLSIVIPAYNEAERLPTTLRQIQDRLIEGSLGSLSLREVIVVDDGSTDETSTVAMRFVPALPMSIVRLPQNRGKGAAVRAGVLRATSDTILMYDADGATPIEEVEKLAMALAMGSDVAIGSRVMDEGQALSSMRLHRRFIGQAYRLLTSHLIPGIRDVACGCKLFRKDAAHVLFSKQTLDRFAFDVEVIALALRSSMRVTEIPVRWTAVDRSKVRLVQDGVEMFLSVLRLYVRFFLQPKGNRSASSMKC